MDHKARVVEFCKKLPNSVPKWLSHQQCMRVPVAPHPHQHLVLSVFWILAILKGV